VHSLVALFQEVIVLPIILLFVGLAVLKVLIVVTRTIVASIVLMTIARLVVVVVATAASMVVAKLGAMKLLVAQFTAMYDKKMSHLIFFWRLLSLAIFSRMPAGLLAT
jgi:hypothetical protein